MKTVIKTPPAAELFTTADLKSFLRVSISDDDTMIDAMGVAARQLAEHITQRAFINQDWYLYFDNPSCGLGSALRWDEKISKPVISLPFPPVSLVVAFEYQSAAGVWTAVDSSLYYTDAADNSRIIITGVLPTPAVDASGFRVTYRAGYGSAGTNVPAQILLAVKTFVLHFYEHREAYDFSIGNSGMSPATIPQTGTRLLEPYKIPRN
jgi:uncharacterized phiE125 gp8 family phage protein